MISRSDRGEGLSMNVLTRRWATLITLFYAVVVILLLVPFASWLAEDGQPDGPGEMVKDLFFDPEGAWYGWSWLVALVAGQALLVLLSVDTARRRLTPRRRIAATVIALTLAVGLLSAAALGSVAAAIDEDTLDFSIWLVPIAWLISGAVFYVYREGLSHRLDRVLNWLLAGSVLELLIVLPCHIVVRQRDDCCAPAFTALGIATGIAVMLMCFGPGILLLYQRRLALYRTSQ
jgi:hypothetical protein